jgi:hypothetical protein
MVMSQHGLGEKCNWGQSGELTQVGRHVVYVAHESHANYFSPGVHPRNNLPDDVTRNDGTAYYEVPSVVDVTNAPGWILWNGSWGDSSGFVNSPKSPGVQPAWNVFAWEADPTNITACTPPPPSSALQARSSSEAGTPQVTDLGRPSLPRLRSARLVSTKHGTAVRVSYCFASMPADSSRRPARLHLALENLRDKLPPLSVGWTVARRCGTILHPVGPIKRPYLLRYSVESRRGTWSKRAQIRLG